MQDLVTIVPWTFIAQICNLFIQMYLIKRFLFKPVNAILEKRQQEADARFVQADAQEAAAQEKAQKYDSLLEDAQNEKERIVTRIRQTESWKKQRQMRRQRKLQ